MEKLPGASSPKGQTNLIIQHIYLISYPQVYDPNGKKLPLILWTNSLTEEGHVEKYLSKDDYIIQIWTKGNDSVVKELIEKDFRVIFSNYDAWYLDCGYSSWVGEGNNWCSPYKGWQVSPSSHLFSVSSSSSLSRLSMTTVLGSTTETPGVNVPERSRSLGGKLPCGRNR